MGRRLTLLLIVYVTLDFANPLMPGAVRFDAGGVGIVAAHGTVRPDLPAPEPEAALPVVPLVAPPPIAGSRPGAVPETLSGGDRRQPPPRGRLSASPFPSPSSDDH